MVLSDRDIKKALAEKRIKIKPAPDFKIQLGSCSIDLRLGNVFRIFNRSHHFCIDFKNHIDPEAIMRERVVQNGKAFIMHPGEFVLATTKEHLELADDLLGRLEGRSSLGRLGIVVHSTASVFDPGWRGKPVMELGNLGVLPVALYPGMRICAFTFEEVSSPVETPYWKRGKYANEKRPLASRLNKELRKELKWSKQSK